MIEGMSGFEHGLTNYGDSAFSLYLRRSFAKSMGYSSELLVKPIVGIADSRSGFNNCHRHFPELIEAVKRGVLAAGALPIDFPTVSLGEVFLSPTAAAPVASAARSRSACTAGIAAVPGRIMPSASTRQAMVEAVPMTAQVPAVTASLPSTSEISASLTSPAR